MERDMTDIAIREDDLQGPEIAALLEAHFAHDMSKAPPESNHALDLEGLRAPEVTVWTVWQDGALLGCGALKELDPGHGEIKSMHTDAAHRGKGVGARLLSHILEVARRRGYGRLSLETGTRETFPAAHGLYARFGFRDCLPFAHYREDPHSAFLTLEL